MFETVINLKPESEWRPGMTVDKLIAEQKAVASAPVAHPPRNNHPKGEPKIDKPNVEPVAVKTEDPKRLNKLNYAELLHTVLSHQKNN